ncbi:MAG: NADH-quinone oxidoreductase subunit C [Slackia sp.]|nr:NADH-quinone oxidoreductase subunit C [Slackia sp.]
MALQTIFETIETNDLPALAQEKRDAGYRFVQMLCVNTEQGLDALYTFMKGDRLENYTICGIDAETQTVPSVTEFFLSAFPFENEAHDLFGLNVTDIAIDFAGNFYRVAMDKPMTVISPAQKAAREKAAKIAAAKAAKQAGGAKQEDDLEAKLANMDPDKAAKVRAAMAAKAAKEKAAAERAKADALEEKLSGMDPEKAAKVRAAMEAKAARDAAQKKGGE